MFQLNQQYDTLLPVTPCVHKLKAGIAYLGNHSLTRLAFQLFQGASAFQTYLYYM
jgi:hypothetical protein